jgi:hypothetical protein
VILLLLCNTMVKHAMADIIGSKGSRSLSIVLCSGCVGAEHVVSIIIVRPTPKPTSKGTFLRVNNNNKNFNSGVLFFLRENLKKVQDSCWYCKICANVQVFELQRHIFLGTLFKTLFHDFMFCLFRRLNHYDVSQTMMTSRMTR